MLCLFHYREQVEQSMTKEERAKKKTSSYALKRICAVAGCPSRYQACGSQLHRFPDDPHMNALWNDFAALTGNKELRKTPNLCNEHFREDQFEFSSLQRARFGISQKLVLKKNAVPTIIKEKNMERIRERWTKQSKMDKWQVCIEVYPCQSCSGTVFPQLKNKVS